MINQWKKRLWAGLTAVMLALAVSGQTQVCDSLQLLLEQHLQRDTTRMFLLYRMAIEKRFTDTKAAEKLIEEGYAIAMALDHKAGIVDGLEQQAALDYRKGNFTRADSVYRVAVQIAMRQKMTTSVAQLKYDIGILYSRQKRMKEAQQLFEEALPVFRASGDQGNVVKCLFNLGRVAAAGNDVQQAMSYYTDGLRLTEENGLSKEKALIYSNMGALYFSMKEWQKALECFEKARPVYEELNDRGLLAGSYQQSGTVHIMLGNYVEATACLLQARDIFRQLGYKSQLRHALGSLGVLAKKQGKYGEALTYYKEIYREALACGDTVFQLSSLINEGSLYLALKKYRKALEANQKALVLAEAGHQQSDLVDIYANMTEIYRSYRNYKEAFEWQRKHKIACDSLYNKEKFRQLEELRTKYDVEVKELKIGNLEKQTRLQSIALGKERFIRNGVAVLLLLSVSIAFVFYRQNKRIRTANRNLVMKNKEVLKVHERFIESLKTAEEKKAGEGKRGEAGAMSEETVAGLVHAIEELFKEERLYRDNALSLTSLARRLNTNTTYLSRVINEYYGQSFSSFINTFRVNAAQRMLLSAEYGHLTIEGIAREVGFNSKSSFNTAFKSLTGLTPSAYKKARE